MIKNELSARFILLCISIIPLYLAFSSFQSNEALLTIAYLLMAIYFLLYQLNIRQFLMSKPKISKKMRLIQRAIMATSAGFILVSLTIKNAT
jgi:hypothetical protein